MRQTSNLAILLAGIGLTQAAFSADKITYDDHIYPIFSASCLNCHNPDKKKGDLDLSTFNGTLAGGSGGKIVLAGDGAGSKLFTCVVQTAEPKMPPEGDKLGKKETDLIRAWIDSGLLENKSSKARKKQKPAFDLTPVTNPNAKPEGPPPMPEDLLLEPVIVAKRSGIVKDMESSPWAPLLAVTGQKQVLLYNTDTLQLAAILPFPHGMPEVVSFHPSGRYLLAGGGIGGKSGTTITWEIKTGKPIITAGKEFDSILAADIRADLGGVAFGGPSRLIKLWDTRAGEQLMSIKKHTEWVTALSYSPDGILLATADRNNGVQVWEAETGNEFHSLRGHQKGITALAWRADSNLLATASEDGQFIMWEMNNGKQVKRQAAHGGGTLSLDYGRDGRLVTSGRDKRVKIWKADFNLQKELPAFTEMVTEVAFSHDAKRVFAADYHGTITAWDATTFKQIGELSANPPTIAKRIESLKNELTNLPAEKKKRADALAVATKNLNDAKARLANTQKTINDTKAGINKHNGLVGKLDGEWNALNQKHSQLQNLRNQQEGQMKQALAAHKQKVDETNRFNNELKQLNGTYQSLTNTLTRLTQNHAAAQKAHQQKPDDQNLKNKAIEAKKQLDAHQAKVQQAKGQVDQKKNQINQNNKLVAQLKTKADQARNTFTKTNADWQTVAKQRNDKNTERINNRKTLGKLKSSLPGHEKALKPAQDHLAQKQKELAPQKAAVDQINGHENYLKQQIKHWSAAQINTDRLAAAAELRKAQVSHDDALAEFASLAKNLSKKETEDKSGKQNQLIQLKSTLNELASSLTQYRAKANQLAQAYQNAKK